MRFSRMIVFSLTLILSIGTPALLAAGSGRRPGSQEYYSPSGTKRTSRFSLGIITGYRSPAESNYEGKPFFGGVLSVGLVRYLSLEFEACTFKMPVKGKPDDLSRGSLTVVPLMVSLFFRYPAGERIIPYFGGGIGYYSIQKVSLDSSIKNSWEALGFDVRESVENTIGFHAGGGVDYRVSGLVGLNLDVRYCFVEPEGKWSFRDQISGEETGESLGKLDFKALMIGLGLRILF